MATNDNDPWKQLQDAFDKKVTDAAKQYDEWKNRQQLRQNSPPIIGSVTYGPTPYTGTSLPVHTMPLNPTPKKAGRPHGTKTKDKEIIIQETVDRLMDHAARLLTKYNYSEEALGDTEIVVDEKANYAFVTITVNCHGMGIISVSERVKVANKTDPSKNWQALNKAFNKSAAKLTAAKIVEDFSNLQITDHDF